MLKQSHVYDVRVNRNTRELRALCVGRHEFIAEHLGRYFAALGIETEVAVGLERAVEAAQRCSPDVVLCEYELLATLPLAAWEDNERLSHTAIIAVSLSRRPNELHPLDVNSISGFLYLPTLDAESALRLIRAAAASTRAQYSPLPPSTSPPHSERNLLTT